MPGIIGFAGPNTKNVLSSMEKELFITPFLHRSHEPSIAKTFSVYGLGKENRIAANAKHLIGFEGYLSDIDLRGNDLLSWLLEQYAQKGEDFVRDLRGSFVIALVERGGDKWMLYSDQTASRPFFYALQNGSLFFSPEIGPLAAVLENRTPNKASLLQFLISGYLFSGTTLIKEIKQIRPGELLVFEKNAVKLRKYFDYKVKPEKGVRRRDVIPRLNKALSERIGEMWRMADSPAVLLSGGYDSRYIMLSIAENVTDATKILAVSWGQDSGRPGSDLVVADEIVKKLGCRHVVIEKNTENFEQDFERMFTAQSGMTDAAFYHSGELAVCESLRTKHGVNSLFRGDECFGFGTEVFTMQNALRAVAMSYPEFVPGLDGLIAEQWKETYAEFHEELRKRMDEEQHPNDLKDTLYCNERLTMALHPLNYFKYGYQNIFLPLIDVDVLQIVRTLPRHMRDDKAIFKDCLSARFPRFADIPFATRNNLLDWNEAVAGNAELHEYLKARVNALPSFFNRNSFLAALEESRRHKRVPPRKGLKSRISQLIGPDLRHKILQTKARVLKVDCQLDNPAIVLVFRATVLSKWFQKWL